VLYVRGGDHQFLLLPGLLTVMGIPQESDHSLYRYILKKKKTVLI
jgi:hypothetical protein